jgi:OOP family OmpA-OmpF porin
MRLVSETAHGWVSILPMVAPSRPGMNQEWRGGRRVRPSTPALAMLALGLTVTALAEPAGAEPNPSPAPTPPTTPVAASPVGSAAPTAPAKRVESSSSSVVPVTDEPPEYRFEFGLDLGAHFFNKKSGLGRNEGDPEGISPATALAFGGHLALNFNHWVSVEAEALGIPTHTNNAATRIWAFAYRGMLIVHLVPTGPVRPFISLGYGGISTVVNNTAIVPSDTDGMVQAGVGLKIAMGDHAGLRLEGRVVSPPAFLGSKVPVGNEVGYDGPDWEALGSLFVNFGEVEKVRETIVQREVVMVQPPPPPDPDGDGIVGASDKCPELAEDKDGFEDEDGCPDLDNDKDGIPDAQDKCPNKPETVNGIDDDDGCPEVDTDGDGILGSRDKCPDEPETVNGYKDDDGCPDEVPAAVKKFTGVIEGINFKTGQSTILPGSYPILDRAVGVLKEYGDIRLEIAGHTDSRGKSDYNRDLSQKRADAVKAYFIANGIDPVRVTTIGYGMDRPIADNATEAGRSKNRRTEFRLLTGNEAGGASKVDLPRGDSGPPPPESAPIKPVSP